MKVQPQSGRSQIEDSSASCSIIYYIIHLLHFSHLLFEECGNIEDDLEVFTREIERLTQGDVHLVLHHQPSSAHSSPHITSSMRLPVQFGNIVYGTLSITHPPEQHSPLSLHTEPERVLAQLCGWILYTLEQLSFIRAHSGKFDYQYRQALTKREREILILMYRGYNQREIARELCISPATVRKHRQHIYEHLDVHSKHEALMAAYRLGIVSMGAQASSREI